MVAERGFTCKHGAWGGGGSERGCGEVGVSVRCCVCGSFSLLALSFFLFFFFFYHSAMVPLSHVALAAHDASILCFVFFFGVTVARLDTGLAGALESLGAARVRFDRSKKYNHSLSTLPARIPTVLPRQQ